MRAFAIMCAGALVCSSAFGLTLFKDLNLAGNAITNVSKIELSGDATVANVGRIQFASGEVISNAAAPGDIRYPDGYNGTPVMIRLYGSYSSLMYTVPVNRTLYVLSGYSDGGQWLYASTNGVSEQPVWYFGSLSYKNQRANKFHTPMVFPEKTVLRTDSSSSLYLTGIEVPKGVEVVVLRLDTSTGYTVPEGKKLYVMSGCMPNSNGTLQAQRGSYTWEVYYFHDYNNDAPYSSSFAPLVFDSGVVLKASGNYYNYPIYITGYLK